MIELKRYRENNPLVAGQRISLAPPEYIQEYKEKDEI